ncbi:3-oxoacyl-ACP reductase FabG [Myceligenerans halotolerans]
MTEMIETTGTAEPSAGVSLKGRVALVSGAGRNTGRAIALAFANAGADVVVNVASNTAEMQAVVEEVEGYGVRAIGVQADVSQEDDVEHMFAEALDRLGPVTVLVNNVALRPRTGIRDMTADEWDRVHAVGLRGPFLACRAAVRHMDTVGWGRIINTSGQDAFTGRANRAHGVAAKAGIHGLTKALAVELAPSGITVNTIVPGTFRTSRPAKWYPNLDYDKTAERVPVQRIGEPYELARACLFLATDPGYITGSALHVNGGSTIV